MGFNKIGFHTSVGGNPTGIGDWMRALDAAGIPFFIKCSDAMTGLFEAQELVRASGQGEPGSPAHTAIFRRSVGKLGTHKYDVPDYAKEPKAAALEHWQKHKAEFPPELDRNVTWVEIYNELRKEVDAGDWIGELLAETALIALEEGFRFAGPGYSTGTPEIGAWETPGMLRYLRLCQEHSGRLGVALHEYSLTVDDIWALDPDAEGPEPGWRIGRFRHLFDACDRHGIARPPVLITEWGWTHEKIPADLDRAMQDIREVAEMYAAYPRVLGAAIWYLGQGFGGIADRAQKLIRPLTEFTLSTTFDVPEIPPVEEPMTFEEHLWQESIDSQKANGLSLNPGAALQAAVFKAGYVPVDSERRTVYDDVQYAYQPAEHLGGHPRRVYYARVPQWNDVRYITEPGAEPPPEPEPQNYLDVTPYSQRDPRWAGETLGGTGSTETIGGWGCLMVVYCMQANYWGLTDDDPSQFNKRMTAAGAMYQQYTLPGALQKTFPDRVVYDGYKARADAEMEPMIRDWIDHDRPVPARVDFRPATSEREQHWVLLVGYKDDGDFIMADPWTGKIGTVADVYGIPGVDVLEAIFYRLKEVPTPTPSPTTVDLTRYFVPSGDAGRFAVMHALNGAWTMNVQMVKAADGSVYMMKGNEWEHWRINDGYLERREDTSPGRVGGRKYYYMLDDGNGWSRWCPIRWQVGGVYERKPVVRKFWYPDDSVPAAEHCRMFYERQEVTYLRFAAMIARWVSPVNENIVLENVVELQWLDAPGGNILETYLLAPELSYNAFGRGGQITEAIGELPDGRKPLPAGVLPCP